MRWQSRVRNSSRQRVADAWRVGRSLSAINVYTTGRDVYSYGHKVGYTENGRKVAICCHYSQTTAKHCSAFKGVADDVIECADHNRPQCRVYRACVVAS